MFKFPSENDEQIAFVKWLKLKHILFYHIPNGGFRSIREGIRFKLLGVRAGVPDICIPIPANGFHGLYIEMKKTKGGKLSMDQSAWIEELCNQKYHATVAHGCEEAVKIVEEYFEAD